MYIGRVFVVYTQERNRYHTYQIPYASLLLVVTRGYVHCGIGEDLILGMLIRRLLTASCVVCFRSKTGQPYKRGLEGP